MIAIIGGGITGLAAAYELMVRRVPFQLFEASPRLGGIIRTEHVDGFTIEAGPDSILAQKPAALALCEALDLRNRLIATNVPRTAFVLKDGRLHPLPTPSVLGIPTTWRGLLKYDLLSPGARVRLAMEPLIRRRRTVDDESVAAFFRRRFGDTTVSAIAEPLLGGIHAGNIDALSIRSLFPRFIDAEAQHGSVLRAFHRHQGSGADGLFRSLLGGMEELVTTIEHRLPANAVHKNAVVVAVAPDGGAWRIATRGGTTLARAVVLACPAHVAATLIRPIDARSAELCSEVPYVSTASVALAWPRHAIAHPLNGSGFVVARGANSRVRITACTWVSSKWSNRAPSGMALLRAFVGGSHDPSAVDAADDDLAELAVNELTPILTIKDRPILTRVYRWRQAGAQHNVGHIARVAEIERRLAAHRGLFVAGSGFRSVGIPDCVADGRAAAASACGTIQ
ncbi:MAG TPA: protoporphyrinogen oxidase [Vicinamibacterales bacterium]|nr:protoporphyrinogen oxidase [Vicinamibacterales bacterium]